MGNKISTSGFRIGITQDWKSKWYADKKNYGTYVIEDEKIRKFFNLALKNAGLESVIIERSFNELKVYLRVSRPGVVIGRGGAGINMLKDELSKLVNSKVSLTVEEVKRPEASAELIAQSLANQIERRVNYKKAALSAMTKAKDQGIKGIKISIAGVLSGGNTIARSEVFKYGSIPQTTIKADIDFALAHSKTFWGVIGVKVWVY